MIRECVLEIEDSVLVLVTIENVKDEERAQSDQDKGTNGADTRDMKKRMVLVLKNSIVLEASCLSYMQCR